MRYILTSQKWEADVGNFQLHAIYNMSSEAASQLLSKLAPSLTDDQKMQIAELTGNVPLALDVVGAIFKFPNAPTAEEVIQGLKKHPVTTLSPPELYSHLDTSIGLAYRFLSLDLKELCINLPQFPGSFDQLSASRIVYAGTDIEPQLKTLVRRSLLFNQQTRFHFHQLIREYFLQKSGAGKRCGGLMQNFKSEFLQYFAEYLKSILQMTTYKALDADKHNLQCMFAMFATAEQNNVTLHAVTITLTAIQSKFLQARFSDKEIYYDILQNMLKAMDSYSADEEASHESFFELYHKIVFETLNVGKLLHMETHSLIKILMSRKNKVDGAYKRGLLGVNTYIQYFTDLAQLYEENGKEANSRWCHAHILSHVHHQLHGCYPDCDYFNVSLAYESVGESVEAFHFRELAFEHQATSLDHMSLIQLHLALYNDYMNSSLGNNVTKAAEFSSLIISVDYVYLISADKYEYRKKVYYDTLDFFRAKHMEYYIVQIQNKMLAVERGCSSDDCVDYYMSSSLHAWERQSYYLTIELGKLGFEHSKMSIEACEPNSDELHTAIVGVSYYYIGNYSDAQIWLKQALQIMNENLKEEHSLKLREERVATCSFLLMSGDYFNVLCYGYIIKDFTILLSYLSVEHLYTQYIIQTQQPPKQQPAAEAVILSTETGVTDKKYSFVWSLGLKHVLKHVHKFQSIMDKYVEYVSAAEKTVYQLQLYKYFVCCMYVCVCGCFLLTPFLILCAFYLCIIKFIRCLMSVCCTKQQIAKCCTLYKFMAIACITTTFVFMLGLDWLY